MSQPSLNSDPLLLPRVRRVDRIEPSQLHESVGLPFPENLGAHGAPLHLFESTLGPAIHATDAGQAHIVVIARQHEQFVSPLGYFLSIARTPSSRVTIESATEAGVRAGLQTLAQLFRQFGRAIPPLEITDWPAFPTRGVMLDVSRCRIPTMAEFRRIIPLLASLKFNHLQLYTEHTFAYRDHKAVWEGWDPITADEVRELSALCTLHGITLAANQNTFGHMKHWLDQPKYAGLAETHDDFDFYGMARRGPFSLCPTDPAARAFACGLLDELVPNFAPTQQGSRRREPGVTPGRQDALNVTRTLVNIGCDETADVGAGRSRDAVARLGKAAVYADHVGAIMRHCLDRGWTPQFWADIALAHPEVLDLLPREAIPLAWGYEPDSPFERWGRTLAASGREWWVCPGTSSWRSITGRATERKANIESAARAGVAHGASGFMVCDWGDIGHTQQWSVTLNAIAQAADAAWTGGQDGYNADAASLHAFGDATLTIGRLLDRIGDADLTVRRRARSGTPPLVNASGLFTALWPARQELADPLQLAPLEDWQALEPELSACQAMLVQSLKGDQSASAKEQVRFTLHMASLAAMIATQPNPGAANRDRLVAHARWLQRWFGRLWIEESRAGGLAHTATFWDELCARIVARGVEPGTG